MATKFTTSELSWGVRQVTNVLPKKPMSVDESTLYLRPGKVEGKIEIGAGSERRGARTLVNYDGDPLEKTIPVHAASLAAVTRFAPGENTSLEFNDTLVEVQSGAAKSKVKLIKVEPHQGETEEQAIEKKVAAYTPSLPARGSVPGAQLVAAIKAVSWTHAEQGGPELESVRLTFGKDEIEVSAMSPYAMSRTKVPFTEAAEAESEGLVILLPQESYQTLLTDLPVNEDVNLHWSANGAATDPVDMRSPSRVAFSTSNYWVCLGVAAVPKVLPNHEKLYNTDDKATLLEVDAKELSNTLARVKAAIGATGTDSVSLVADTNDNAAVTFEVSASGDYDHKENLAARVTGQAINGACSEKYLSNVVKSLGGNKISIKWTSGDPSDGAARLILSSDRDENLLFMIPRQIKRS